MSFEFDNHISMEPFNFDKLPEVVRQLFEKVENLEILISEMQPKAENVNDFLDIHEASEFLKITVASLYTKVCRRQIPYNKPGKRLYFNKTDLIKWLGTSRKKTAEEITQESQDRYRSKRMF